MTDLTDLPVIGNWARKVGQVSRMMATPCSISAQIWVEAFFAAEAHLVWSLFKPDIFNPVFSRRGGRHGRGVNLTFNFGQLIEEEKFVGGSAFRAALFTIGELASTIGWYMLLIDAGVDLAVNWMSLAYQWSGCAGGRYCQLKGDWLMLAGEKNNPHPAWAYEAGDNGLNAVDGIIVPAGGTYGVGLSISSSVWPLAGPPVGGVSATLLNTNTGKNVIEIPTVKTDPLTLKGSGSGMAIFKNNTGSNVKLLTLFSCEGGYALITGSSLTVTDQSVQPFAADP